MPTSTYKLSTLAVMTGSQLATNWICSVAVSHPGLDPSWTSWLSAPWSHPLYDGHQVPTFRELGKLQWHPPKLLDLQSWWKTYLRRHNEAPTVQHRPGRGTKAVCTLSLSKRLDESSIRLSSCHPKIQDSLPHPKYDEAPGIFYPILSYKKPTRGGPAITG